jgi:hypothetical protein
MPGQNSRARLSGCRSRLEIVKRTDKNGGFRRRWVIERTFSWLRRNRRLMAHYEALALSALGFAKLAMIAVMLKRLTQVTPCLSCKLPIQALRAVLPGSDANRARTGFRERMGRAKGTPQWLSNGADPFRQRERLPR